MSKPLLSVVMPVYNGEKYLKEAIESVLSQTYKDFELIIINDGSSDNSLKIINEFSDNRIRVINNETNLGIPRVRNIGLSESAGCFLAWCDCDDICLPTRFEEQLSFLEKNQTYGACGTWLIGFDERSFFKMKPYKSSEIIKATLLFKSLILNPTVMLRLSEIRKNQLQYNTNLVIAEDYDFFLRCSRFFPMTNITKVLYKYRASETSIMKKFSNLEKESYDIHKLIYSCALKSLEIHPSETELNLHWMITSDKLFRRFSDYVDCFKWLCHLKQRNNVVQYFDNATFNAVLAEQFLFISKKASRFGMATLRFYLTNSFGNFGYASLYNIGRLTFRCIIKFDKFSFR